MKKFVLSFLLVGSLFLSAGFLDGIEAANRQLEMESRPSQNNIVGSSFANNFCKGFERGYISGYKQANNSSMNPITPICPIQPIKGFGDPQSDYEHGYTIGYRHGMAEGTR